MLEDKLNQSKTCQITPFGVLTATAGNDKYYPSIVIDIDGKIIAQVQYYDGKIRTLAWNERDDGAESVTVYHK